MKKVLAIILSAIMLIGLCACSSSVSLRDTEWKMTGLEVEGLKVDEEFLAGYSVSGSIVFGDKEATLSINEGSDVVTYTVDEMTVTMVKADGQTRTANIIGEKNDTMVMEIDGYGVATFTKVQ